MDKNGKLGLISLTKKIDTIIDFFPISTQQQSGFYSDLDKHSTNIDRRKRQSRIKIDNKEEDKIDEIDEIDAAKNH